MCHADTGLYRVEWLKEPNEEGEVHELRSNGETTCVDWDKFYDWAEKRALPTERSVKAPGWSE